ncbi:MFS transporter [Streptomyces sp. NPDC088847]|uniref:MFS transporter n=1 Tax=Streptomyces sp. NPDC088847 TaxID=3365909 RepID=UPI003809BBD2
MRLAGHPGLVLTVLYPAAFMASLDVFIGNPAFGDIGHNFGGARLSDLSWILHAYTISYTALLVHAGQIADRFGRESTFMFGMGLLLSLNSGCRSG